MRERTVLELIEKIADAQFHKTGDKWWKEIAKKIEDKQEETKWWLK